MIDRRPRIRGGSAREGVRLAHARGQALLETLVGAIVLVPLVLLVVWLGKVQTLRQATIAASASEIVRLP